MIWSESYSAVRLAELGASWQVGLPTTSNNLLCGVVATEIARRKLPNDAPPALSRCLTEILTFAGEAAQLSKQMLAYAGRRSPAIQALELNAELSAALRLLQRHRRIQGSPGARAWPSSWWARTDFSCGEGVVA